ncbi:MAG: hypothetical protein LBJ70_01380 [Holosporales bacterium]|jgi:hypothetical protein|nr:hypothetical protein [Holosporales bacterium]
MLEPELTMCSAVALMAALCFTLVSWKIKRFEQFAKRTTHSVQKVEKAVLSQGVEIHKELSAQQEKLKMTGRHLQQEVREAERLMEEMHALTTKIGHLVERLAQSKNALEARVGTSSGARAPEIVCFPEIHVKEKPPSKSSAVSNSFLGKNLSKILRGMR